MQSAVISVMEESSCNFNLLICFEFTNNERRPRGDETRPDGKSLHVK